MLKDGRYWILIIVGLLGVSVVANVILVVKATNDPSFAVEPDYYQKAVDWDAHQAAVAESQALGWRVAVKAARDSLEVRLLEKDGTPISDATLEVEAFHNARANRVVTGELEAKGGGLYAMRHPFERPGIWEYRFVAVRDGARYVETVKEEVR